MENKTWVKPTNKRKGYYMKHQMSTFKKGYEKARREIISKLDYIIEWQSYDVIRANIDKVVTVTDIINIKKLKTTLKQSCTN